MKPTILTHDSSFHSDDVFAVATMLLIFPEAQVVRSRDNDKIAAADYVIDVGMRYDPAKNRFDHHQPEGVGTRPNGIPYASFGLVWKEFGEKIAGSLEAAEMVDIKLAQPLDAHDNGTVLVENKFKDVRDYTINDFLYSFLLHPHETKEDLYKIFIDLTVMARGLIEREAAKANETLRAERTVKEVYEKSEDKRILILPEEIEWRRVVSQLPEVMFVIYPRNDSKWSIRAVEESQYVSKLSLPESWGGKSGEELQQVTGVKDAIFCHRARFMAAAKSQEGALALAEIALNS